MGPTAPVAQRRERVCPGPHTRGRVERRTCLFVGWVDLADRGICRGRPVQRGKLRMSLFSLPTKLRQSTPPRAHPCALVRSSASGNSSAKATNVSAIRGRQPSRLSHP